MRDTQRELLQSRRACKIASWCVAGIGVGLFLLGAIWWWHLSGNDPNKQKEIASQLCLWASSIVITVAAILFSVFSSCWYTFYNKIYDTLGIADGEATRKGGDGERDDLWIQRLRSAKSTITLTGTTAGNWFKDGYVNRVLEALDELCRNPNISMRIFLLDPASGFFINRAREELDIAKASSNSSRRDKSLNVRLSDTLEALSDFLYPEHDEVRISRASGYRKKIHVYLYKATPISVIWIDEVLYVTHYLPEMRNRVCPDLVLEAEGEFAKQFKEAIRRLQDDNNRCYELSKKEHFTEVIAKLKSEV